jgi:hypothetical protein
MARKQEQVSRRVQQRVFWAIVTVVGVPLAGRSLVAWGADRPSEDDMFGGGTPDAGVSTTPAGTAGAGGPTPAPPSTSGTTGETGGPAAQGAPPSRPEPQAEAAPAGPPSRDDLVLGDPNASPRLSGEVAPDDPLKIGGQIYFRAAYSKPGAISFDFFDPNVTQPGYSTFSAPSLVDAYFDARPNDRVRGFVLGRMFFDPTLPSEMAPANTGSMSGMTGSTGDTVNPSVPLLSGVSRTRGPTTMLDQLWLRFDILQTVFVTAGRQHVKWGTARFWTPTDYLHPEHRNPVAAFDARPGFTMLKLHLPWEERASNFYAFALVEGVRRWDAATNTLPVGRDTTSTLGQLGGAARAELVFGPAELGLDAVVYRDQKPRYGADLSFGVGDFDFYVDAGFRYGSELPRAHSDFTITYSSGIKPQVTTGGTFSIKYNDNDVFTLAGEYFFNSRGYADPTVYPALFNMSSFEFFYTGRHYAALSALLPAPWTWNYTNFTFTTLGNLSDQSFISRLDYSHTLLTHLTFEAFGAVNYGRREGEFRLGVDQVTLPPVNPGGPDRTFSKDPEAFSLGIGLRVKI